MPTPCSPEGWAALGAFVVLLLATGLSHAAAMRPLRVGPGAGYFAFSFIKSERA